jgi:hypothetical protein
MTAINPAMRFLQAAAFAVSASLAGPSCNRTSETNDVSPSAPLPAPPVPDPSRQWDDLISGHSGLSAETRSALRRGADEEALALNPRTPLQENLPATVSRARHQRAALAHYESALQSLGEDPTEVRRRVRGKIASLNLSLQSLDEMNRRLFGER